ncbi:MAG: hypothetical protein Q9M89_06400 [Persephonella sp.]|nr:hypothetical protein [Persephonella sp.]
MEKTPYAYEFLWKQIETGYREIRKEKYRKLVGQFLFDEEVREKGRETERQNRERLRRGLLERTASVVSSCPVYVR